MKTRSLLPLAVLLAATTLLRAADWPQFGGPDRNNVSKEKGLLQAWPDGGPKLAWTANTCGVGYSAPAVAGDRVYLLGGRDGSEFLLALDAANGKELWAARIAPLFKGNNWNQGPSATPTVDGDLIFALSGAGTLACFDRAGKQQWSKDLPRDLGAQVNPIGGGPPKLGWGFAWSPLVDGDKLICQPGGPQGTLAALDKKTGKVIWQSKAYTDQASYASPLAAGLGGARQYVNLTNEGITAVSAKDGSVLWRYQRKPPYNDCVIPTPVIHGNLIYATVGFGLGCDLIKVTAQNGTFTVEKVYANKNMQNQSGGVVLLDGHVYGYTDGRRAWICQNLTSGQVVWAQRRALGRGSIIAADGRLFCYGEEDGVCVLAEASPKAWAEKGRLTIPKRSKLNKIRGKIWTHPVVANGKLYLRDQEFLFCYNVKK